MARRMAVSADGNTIVGGGYDFGHDGAWIWRPGNGCQTDRDEQRTRRSLISLDVSDDGKTAVGFTRRTGLKRTACLPLERRQRRRFSLTKYLADHGVVVPDGWDLNVASLISADGNTVYGWGFNPDNLIEMFKVELRIGDG